MKRPTVLLDTDGVLADFVGAYLGILEDQLGIRATREQITEFDMGKALGLEPNHAKHMWQAIGASPRIARSLGILPGAIEGVKQLERLADVYIVTSPWNSNPTWCHDREHWLAANFGIPHKRVIHTSAKSLIRGDVLIDDKGSTVIEWNAAHPGKTAILWAAEYNRLDPWAGVRTNDWNRVCSIVEAVS